MEHTHSREGETFSSEQLETVSPKATGPSPSGPSPPFSVFPYMTPGTTTVIRPSGPVKVEAGQDSKNLPPAPPPPPPPPPETSHVLAAPEVTETVTPNQTEFRAWFRKRVDNRFSMKDSMISYLSRLLDVSGYKTDAARGLKTIEHVMITHTSNRGGARGIFEEGKIAPSRLHVPDSNSFFSLGARKTGANEWDAKELARIINSTWILSKQQCSLVFVGIAWEKQQLSKKEENLNAAS